MIGDLELERARVPGVVEIDVVRVDEGELLVYVPSVMTHGNRVKVNIPIAFAARMF